MPRWHLLHNHRAALQLFDCHNQLEFSACQQLIRSQDADFNEDVWLSTNLWLRSQVQSGKQEVQLTLTSSSAHPGFLPLPASLTGLSAVCKPVHLASDGCVSSVIIIQVRLLAIRVSSMRSLWGVCYQWGCGGSCVVAGILHQYQG
eukprot:jgi/Chrzof1/14450/Cz09g03120.t1